MNEVTQQIAATMRWMKQDMDFRRSQTGLESDPLSPEMQLAGQLLADLEAGKIKCYRPVGEILFPSGVNIKRLDPVPPSVPAAASPSSPVPPSVQKGDLK